MKVNGTVTAGCEEKLIVNRIEFDLIRVIFSIEKGKDSYLPSPVSMNSLYRLDRVRRFSGVVELDSTIVRSQSQLEALVRVEVEIAHVEAVADFPGKRLGTHVVGARGMPDRS